jgi:hypothetical protein
LPYHLKFYIKIENIEKVPVDNRNREKNSKNKMLIGELYDVLLGPDEAIDKSPFFRLLS